MKVFENRVLRKIFGHKKDQEREGWRKSHNEEFHNLYSSKNIIRMVKWRRIRWAEHVGSREEECIHFFCWKAERKRPTGGPRRKWEDIIDLREIEEGDVEWICLAQDMDQWRTFVSTVMNFIIIISCLLPLWSKGDMWNALFHFSFLI
jgi:hypothetical protein